MFVSSKTWLIKSSQVTLLLFVSLICANGALGQSQSNAADLQGFVKDATGAVVPNATVTARNPATNASRTATTNEEGRYQIVNLTPGAYEITVEAPNFKKAVLTKVTITVGQRADVDVSLGTRSDY